LRHALQIHRCNLSFARFFVYAQLRRTSRDNPSRIIAKVRFIGASGLPMSRRLLLLVTVWLETPLQELDSQRP
jgi:hypothetical protein